MKLGGSLLDLPNLRGRLIRVLTQLTRPLIIVGGGTVADRVRSWDAEFELSDQTAHDLAIAAMTYNALRLCDDKANYRLVHSFDEWENTDQFGRVPVLDAFAALKREERQATQRRTLPTSWDVTSDSIAGWLADQWNVDLWLLKSVDPKPSFSDHVDPWFMRAAAGVDRIVWVNLSAKRIAPQVVRFDPTDPSS